MEPWAAAKILLVCVAVPPAPVRVPSQKPLNLLSMDCGQKSFKLVWRCHQPLSGFLAKGHLVTSVGNYKGDNEMVPEAVNRSPGICFTAEENSRKPQLGDRLVKRLCVQPAPQMESLSSK